MTRLVAASSSLEWMPRSVRLASESNKLEAKKKKKSRKSRIYPRMCAVLAGCWDARIDRRFVKPDDDGECAIERVGRRKMQQAPLAFILRRNA